jgi:hypothetical protein
MVCLSMDLWGVLYINVCTVRIYLRMFGVPAATVMTSLPIVIRAGRIEMM